MIPEYGWLPDEIGGEGEEKVSLRYERSCGWLRYHDMQDVVLT